ncbi:hypothetical protein PK35_16235, partial [Tamlana nanhaiensis]
GVKSGHYQLQAYKNWNRNFGDDFVFTKNIEIIDVFKAHFSYETEENRRKFILIRTSNTNPIEKIM